MALFARPGLGDQLFTDNLGVANILQSVTTNRLGLPYKNIQTGDLSPPGVKGISLPCPFAVTINKGVGGSDTGACTVHWQF